jgi:hypothetical protein
MKARAKDTPLFVYLFGSRDPKKNESWDSECAQSDPVVRSALEKRGNYVLLECPVGDRSEYGLLSAASLILHTGTRTSQRTRGACTGRFS